MAEGFDVCVNHALANEIIDVSGLRASTRKVGTSGVKEKIYDEKPLVTFGELVLARRPGAHLRKSESGFGYGAWVGRESRSDEHLVMTKTRVVRSRIDVGPKTPSTA